MCDKNYPEQMLEVAGRLNQALAYFENPADHAVFLSTVEKSQMQIGKQKLFAVQF